MSDAPMIDTIVKIPMDNFVLRNYLRTLVDLFFKILPMRESEEPTLGIYMESLLVELLGCQKLVVAINKDALFMSLVSILQYLIDHQDSDALIFKREVFKAISICNRLKARYAKYAKGV